MRILKMDNQGFSLAEMMVTVAIFLMMTAGFYAALAAGDASWATNSVKMELQSNLRTAMEAMIYELRQAGPASIADVPADDTSYDQMTFRKPSGISVGSIVWQGDCIRFLRGGTSGNDLIRETIPTVCSNSPSVSKVVTQNITSLQFTRSSTKTDEITVNMQASKNTIKGLPITYNLAFTFQIRN